MGRMPKDMRQLMEQAQRMQAELEKAQRELAEKTYEGTAGGGVVKATVRGTGELVEVVFAKGTNSVLGMDRVDVRGDRLIAHPPATPSTTNTHRFMACLRVRPRPSPAR